MTNGKKSSTAYMTDRSPWPSPRPFVEEDGDQVSNVPKSQGDADEFDGVTQSYLRLANLPSFPLDRLCRYEATLWRQACQALFALQFLNRARPRARMPWRGG